MSHTPGLTWRKRKDGTKIAYWYSRRRKGCPLKTYRLWRGGEPSPTEMEWISERCMSLEAELLNLVWRPHSSKRNLNGFVYFVLFHDAIKIGFTTNVARRIRNLNTGYPADVELLHSQPAQAFVEKQLHHKFQSSHLRAEWFRPTDDLTLYIGGLIAGTEFLPRMPFPTKRRGRNARRNPEALAKWRLERHANIHANACKRPQENA